MKRQVTEENNNYNNKGRNKPKKVTFSTKNKNKTDNYKNTVKDDTENKIDEELAEYHSQFKGAWEETVKTTSKPHQPYLHSIKNNLNTSSMNHHMLHKKTDFKIKSIDQLLMDKKNGKTPPYLTCSTNLKYNNKTDNDEIDKILNEANNQLFDLHINVKTKEVEEYKQQLNVTTTLVNTLKDINLEGYVKHFQDQHKNMEEWDQKEAEKEFEILRENINNYMIKSFKISDEIRKFAQYRKEQEAIKKLQKEKEKEKEQNQKMKDVLDDQEKTIHAITQEITNKVTKNITKDFNKRIDILESMLNKMEINSQSATGSKSRQQEGRKKEDKTKQQVPNKKQPRHQQKSQKSHEKGGKGAKGNKFGQK